MICDHCGGVVRIGDWPFCPHGRGANTVITDDIPGGMVVENGFDHPTRFDSHSAHKKALAGRGLEIRAKWAGPHDRHLTRWETVDLDAAAALVSRGVEARQTKRDRWPEATIPITVTPCGPLKASDLT